MASHFVTPPDQMVVNSILATSAAQLNSIVNERTFKERAKAETDGIT